MAKEVGKIISEELEPMAALVIGRLFARCEAAGSRIEEESAYMSLWWGVKSLSSLAIAVGTATHFSIASNNHSQAVRKMIEQKFGVDPETAPMWRVH